MREIILPVLSSCRFRLAFKITVIFRFFLFMLWASPANKGKSPGNEVACSVNNSVWGFLKIFPVGRTVRFDFSPEQVFFIVRSHVFRTNFPFNFLISRLPSLIRARYNSAISPNKSMLAPRENNFPGWGGSCKFKVFVC